MLSWGYRRMIFHGYELISEWKNSQCGKTAMARRDGKTYFLKKYQTPVAPVNNGTLDAKTFEHNKKHTVPINKAIIVNKIFFK